MSGPTDTTTSGQGKSKFKDSQKSKQNSNRRAREKSIRKKQDKSETLKAPVTREKDMWDRLSIPAIFQQEGEHHGNTIKNKLKGQTRNTGSTM